MKHFMIKKNGYIYLRALKRKNFSISSSNNFDFNRPDISSDWSLVFPYFYNKYKIKIV